jgi:hypothetical protein
MRQPLGAVHPLMMATAEPAHIKWLRVVVMVRLNRAETIAANLALSTHEIAAPYR